MQISSAMVWGQLKVVQMFHTIDQQTLKGERPTHTCEVSTGCSVHHFLLCGLLYNAIGLFKAMMALSSETGSPIWMADAKVVCALTGS